MKKVSTKNLVILAVILAAFAVFAVPQIFFQGKGFKAWGMKKGKAVYYCPMHPTYTSDRPGDCPICNMKLVLKEESSASTMGEHAGHAVVPGHAMVYMDTARQQLIGVKLGAAEKRPMKKEIRVSGRVAFDAELYTAQREFLSAVSGFKKAKHGPYHEPLERAGELLDSVRTRLHLLGMSEEEITELEGAARQDKNLILPNAGPARLSIGTGSAGSGYDTSSGLQSQPVPERTGTWVYGNIYEYELPFVKIGVAVKVRVPTFPDKEFIGEVRGLTPVLEKETRSVRLRAKVTDPGGLLQPEMYVDLFIESELGEALAVPAEAVMETGERKIVFVLKGGGHFEPREVAVGRKAGDFYEIKSGLAAGEEVVVSGNFLIDSESRLQAALQGMGGGSGHQHGA